MVEQLLFKLAWSGFSLIFVVVGLYTLKTGREQRSRGKRMEETETTAVRDLQPGTVEVKGTAHPTEEATPMQSPITGTDALVSEIVVERWDSDDEGGHWETIHRDVQTVPTVVDDGTGEVRVDPPSDAAVNTDKTRTEVNGGDDPPEPIQQYVREESELDEASGHQFGPLSVGERRRYAEGVVEPGEEVYVLGRATEEQAGWGERASVIDEPTASGEFVFSDKSEEELVSENKWSGTLVMAFGGLFTAVGSVFALFPWLVL
ncbi:MAG: GIDE domain-containing protein [Halobaculum sp.]|jgi:hypothetical protein